MRTKTAFSFFSKITYPKKKPSPSIPKKGFDSSEIDQTIDNAAEIIEKWNTEYISTTKFYSLFCESKKEAKKFINGVKDLQKSMDSLIRQDPNSESLLRAQKLMQIAMKRLQSEFYQILSMNRAHLDPETVSTYSEHVRREPRLAGDSIVEVEEVSKNSMKELKSIAECMIAAGYAKECASTYKSFRKSIVDEGINRLGVEKVGSSKVKKMPSEVVEMKMRSWIDAFNVAMKTLFSGEKTLCDEVFEGSVSTLRESCFRDISKEGALLLLGFPESVAVRDKKNPNPKKIFTLLDMYGIIIENLPMIESIFSFQSVSSVRSQALSSLNRLSESILFHLVEFESEIRKDSSKTVVPGGGVHPMTISAMDHLSRLAEYSGILVNIVKGSSSSAKTLLPKSYFNVSESSEGSEVRVRFAWMILVLLCKIDGKAEMYKDFSVQYLFLANNLQHVASRARSTSLKHLLGEEWIARHFEKVGQFARSYKRIAWDPLASMCPKTNVEMSPEEAKMKLETFSECFESTCESHSACVVDDPKLMEEMRSSIVGKLLPAYRDFYNAHANAVMLAGTEGGWNVRYTPEDVEKYLSSELFSGEGNVLEESCVFRTSFGLVITRNASRRKKRSLSCRRF